MQTPTFPIPADRMPSRSIVLKGVGPAMHVTSNKPSKMLIVSKSRTQSIKTNGHTDIQFAA